LNHYLELNNMSTSTTATTATTGFRFGAANGSVLEMGQWTTPSDALSKYAETYASIVTMVTIASKKTEKSEKMGKVKLPTIACIVPKLALSVEPPELLQAMQEALEALQVTAIRSWLSENGFTWTDAPSSLPKRVPEALMTCAGIADWQATNGASSGRLSIERIKGWLAARLAPAWTETMVAATPDLETDVIEARLAKAGSLFLKLAATTPQLQLGEISSLGKLINIVEEHDASEPDVVGGMLSRKLAALHKAMTRDEVDLGL
jgi:hypothetical protein